MFLKTTHSLLSNIVKTLTRDKRTNELSCLSRIQGFSSKETIDTNRGFDLGDRYTTEERDVILGKINTCTIEELKKYSITESRLKKITGYRDKNGSFKSVEEILLLQGMETSVLEKFCKSLVKNKSAPKGKNFSAKGDMLSPAFNAETRSASRTYTGIWIWGSLISWAQVDVDCNLLQWKCQSLEETVAKDGLIAVVETVANVVSNLPKSDAYIMESDPVIPFSRMNSTAYFLHLQRQQITASIVSLLGMRDKRLGGNDDYDSLINNVYMMRSRTPARLFNLLIGTEIVSAKAVVEKIIDDRGERNGEDKINIYANPDIKEYYKSLDIYEREQMNWALLLTSAFLNLYVLKIPPKNISTCRRSNVA